MLCDKYLALTPLERVELIGSVVHALQTDSNIFDMAVEIKKLAIRKGLFDTVIINPEPLPEEEIK